MPDQPQKPSSNAATVVMAAILSGAVIIALVGTFLPALIGLTGTPATIMRVAFYAVAVIDVAIAFWLRGRLRRAPDKTVQRQ